MLEMDFGNQFLFDHRLDHISGMVLFIGLLDLVRTTVDRADAAEARGRRLSTAVQFVRFAELTEPIALSVTPAAAGAAGVARQCGLEVCTGTFEFHDRAPRPSDVAPRWPADALRRPVDRALIHRAHPHNALLADVWADGEWLWAGSALPPTGHFLNDPFGPDRSIERLVEFVRQFHTMVHHTEYGATFDDRQVLSSFEADLPCSWPAGDDVRLCWRVCAKRGNRVRTEVSVVAAAGDRRLGVVTMESRAMTAASYDRLRAAKR